MVMAPLLEGGGAGTGAGAGAGGGAGPGAGAGPGEGPGPGVGSPNVPLPTVCGPSNEEEQLNVVARINSNTEIAARLKDIGPHRWSHFKQCADFKMRKLI